ncbi:MAG TPA: protein kinase [Polyangiaceae bacterium]|nr:protein kinase [Polyangiaceae bacterium]
MTSTDSSRVGSVVGGKYRLVRCIGEGGMGEVYEAQHVTVGRRFALKFLQRHLAQHQDALERFRREARAAGALENEHIAGVLDFDIASDGTPFLVMEYLVGESVAELLRREGPLPVTRAVGIVLQVCRGLKAAHDAGIIHRDLKPDNLFSVRRADGSELIKILDFGIAKLSSEESSPALTRSGAMMGTPFYMAPEQARGDKLLDPRVDVYALGVILYELLSAEKPHPGDSHNAILAHILTESIVPLERLRPNLPSALSALIARTLSSSRVDRPNSVEALARELAPFQGNELSPVRSQFDFRADYASAKSEVAFPPELANAKTLPTPDTHALALPATPSAPSTRPHLRRSALIAGGAALLGAFALYAARAPTPAAPNVTAPATSTRAPAPQAFTASEALTASAAPPAATPSTLVADAPRPALNPAPPMSFRTSADIAGRPGGRPHKAPRADSTGVVATTSKPPESPAKTSDSQRSPRVDFDTQNPYQ